MTKIINLFEHPKFDKSRFTFTSSPIKWTEQYQQWNTRALQPIKVTYKKE